MYTMMETDVLTLICYSPASFINEQNICFHFLSCQYYLKLEIMDNYLHEIKNKILTSASAIFQVPTNINVGSIL